MRNSLFALALILISSPAFAACPAGSTTILSCTFNHGAKALESCQDGTTATYAFGKRGHSPELALQTPLADLAYTPWSGIGRSISEEAGFFNAGVEYLLWQSFDRTQPNSAVTAGIIVLKGGQILAQLECDGGSIQPNIDELYTAKENLGQCWDRTNEVWAWGGCE